LKINLKQVISKELTNDEKTHIINLYNQGADVTEICLRSRRSKTLIFNFLKKSGLFRTEPCLGSKTKPYFKDEKEMIYVPPTFKELSKKEKVFYKIKNVRYGWDKDYPERVGKKKLL
jgi:hypothetical protein